jgi:hypothetical protein
MRLSTSQLESRLTPGVLGSAPSRLFVVEDAFVDWRPVHRYAGSREKPAPLRTPSHATCIAKCMLQHSRDLAARMRP